MNGYLLDTNVVAELSGEQPDARVGAWMSATDPDLFWISIVTMAEYEKGAAQLANDDPRRAMIAAKARRIAERFRSRILPLSDDVVMMWGRMAGNVKRDTGHPPPPIDALLAATALVHDLVLVTRNVRDVVHSGATILNPWEHAAP